MSNEDYIVLKILKGLSEHLHCAMRIHRKTVHGKKKHDFNFKSQVKWVSELLYLVDGPKCPAIFIWRWSQDQGRYYQQHSMQIYLSSETVVVRDIRLAWPAHFHPEAATHKNHGNKIVEISNPDCFDLVTQELIKHLDWRG